MKLDVPNLNVDVRAITVDDLGTLMSFIRKMAQFEKLPITGDERTLRDTLFGDNPPARALLITLDGTPIGYATYFFTFASMTAKRGLWLDDLFLDEAYRGKGVGKAFMHFMHEMARKNNCARFEWMVVDWNETAIAFYKQLGAEVFTNWYICRLET